MAEILYQREGNLFTPNQAAGSPWHPGLLHGGSVSGLLGFVVQEWIDTLPAFFVNRLTIDLLRPVPSAPLKVETGLLRDGKRLKILVLEVMAGETLVCRAQALAQQRKQVTLPDYAPRPAPPPSGPEGIADSTVQQMLDSKGLNFPSGLHSHILLREVTPWRERGQSTSWVNIPVQVVDGVPLTPFTRTALMSDFGNGAGQLNLGNNVGSINADITLSLFRYPQSEWICFESEAQMQQSGLGVVHTRLYDTEGAAGFVLQTVQTNNEYQG